jgi:hypothetical protein
MKNVSYFIEKLLNNLSGMFSGNMGEEQEDFEEVFSKMFKEKYGELTSDEQLALHLIHRYNLKMDTLETMPAFNEHIKSLLPKEEHK